MIPPNQQSFFSKIKDGECEHPAKIIEQFFLLFFVKMNDHFRVTIGLEPMVFFQFLLDLLVIVDLTIECDPYRTVFVRHWLLAALEVDNGKPAVTQSHSLFEINPVPVRSSMRQRVGHML